MAQKAVAKKGKKYKFEFNIDRSKWCEGGLLIEDPERGAQMCALGFLGKALGVPKKHLSATSSPSGLPKKYHARFGKLGILECPDEYATSPVDADIADEIMNANDVAREDRETQLKKLFRKLDIKVNFINQFPKDD